MRRWIIVVIILAVVGAGAYLLFGRGSGTLGLGEPTPEPTPLLEVTAGTRVVADAVVLPVENADLTFETSGVRVAEILVEEGDLVVEGQALARLDTRDLQLQIDQAQAQLAQARADLDKLLEGATAQEIAEAQAEVARAQAQQSETQGSVTGSDIESSQAAIQEAQARLNEARTRLARLEAGPRQTDVANAQARLDQARANLEEQRARLSSNKVDANLQIEQSANELRDRQAEYSQIYWDNRELENELARGGDELPQKEKDQEEIALRAVRSAEEALNQAKLAYEEAQQLEITGLTNAEAQVREAQANLDDVLRGFDPDEIEAVRADAARAQADIASAQAQLNKLQGQERAGRLAAAGASVSSAQARLENLLADPTTSELAQAEAVVMQREVEVRQAELALEKATLQTPLAGEVAEINLEIGEIPSDLEPAVRIADFSQWKVETDDLTELSIVNVKVGDNALITFDSIPDLELAGTVTRIKPFGVNKQGDITYTVVITPDQWDDRLLWNMTATVSIESDSDETETETETETAE